MNESMPLKLIGYASAVAANTPGSALGPWSLYYHPILLQNAHINASWETIAYCTSLKRGAEVVSLVKETVKKIGDAVLQVLEKNEQFCVIGGDHSSAIGTWSAVAHANRDKGDIGLIWLDAHMDSHTPETTTSQNIHGMPIAHLLGKGYPELACLFDDAPKIKPENICLIGIRSYEAAEAALLSQLGVKVFFMEDVNKYGLLNVLEEAKRHVSKTTCGFGISLDMDAIDPEDAPGVGCRERDGIRGQELIKAFRQIFRHQPLLGLEITEYNPLFDHEQKTCQLLIDLLQTFFSPLKGY